MSAQNFLSAEFTKIPSEEVLSQLHTSREGLTSHEALVRSQKYGKNQLNHRSINIFLLFLRQITGNPLIIILMIATLASFLLGQRLSAIYIFVMILASVFLGLFNEYAAEHTVNQLLKKISQSIVVVRNNEQVEILVHELTIGDIVILSPGTILPADLRLLEAHHLTMNQSSLTGESQPVHKNSHQLQYLPEDSDEASNIGFMGTEVESGFGSGVVIAIGKGTQFGQIAQAASYLKPTTNFQRGLMEFGQMITKVIIVFTVIIFAVNSFLGHPIVDSLLFSLAIAVGLTPELLPVLVTVSLSHGAGKLAKRHVVAKRLISLENLGNMDILCTDKTGTLTEGEIQWIGSFDSAGQEDIHVLELAAMCTGIGAHHKYFRTALDEAIWNAAKKHKVEPSAKMIFEYEEPFDYDKKAMFSIVEYQRHKLLICKGSLDTILSYSHNSKQLQHVHGQVEKYSLLGQRTVAVATKIIPASQTAHTWADVKSLTFQGYITFADTPKPTAKAALERLHQLSVGVKIITGDNEIVTRAICEQVGFEINKIVLGSELEKMSFEELEDIAEKTNVFAKVNPLQKLHIIEALRKKGHTVGYLGDGMNDVPSLHISDIGISVNTGIDVAKNAASVVLLRKSLNVLADGIIEGRQTFNNTIKYILMATSSNFGNMFSAAFASFFLKFLPMTPVQILLNNGLYDISQMSIPSDNVDPESLLKPRHWDLNFIKRYMLFFGPISSLYDLFTFAILIAVFHASPSLFQTGWFMESIATQILVVFVIRTARTPFFKSSPSKWLLITCLGMVAIGLSIPFSPLAQPLGFTRPPVRLFIVLLGLVATYLGLVEVVKNQFLKRYSL